MASKSFGLAARLAPLSLALGLIAGRVALADDAPPPAPTNADILSLLDQEKPDPAVLAKRDAAANAPVANTLPKDKRAEGFFHRAHARDDAGRINDAIADVEQAIELSKGDNYTRVTSRYQQFLHRLLQRSGDDKGAIKLMTSEVEGLERRDRGRMFSLYDELSYAYGRAGDYAPIERLSRAGHALLAESQSWPAGADPFRPGLEARHR
jgi:hypothetical protein